MKKNILVISIFIIASVALSSCVKTNTKMTTANNTPDTKIAKRKSFEPEMIKIPKGSFLMGCTSGQSCEDDEKPVHKVSIAAFSMGKTEVTFEQWDACVKAGGCTKKANDKLNANDAGYGRGKLPAINVDWEHIQEYLHWLNKETNKNYRLPTEAEWEYAARAGTNTKYWWGNEKPSCNKKEKNGAKLNGGKGSSCFNEYKFIKPRKVVNGIVMGPAIVASYRPNPWGLYDMHGNVQEITCSAASGYPDWHGTSKYNGLETKCLKKSDQKGGEPMPLALRGGGWGSRPEVLRSAARHYIGSDFPLYDIGFRVASN